LKTGPLRALTVVAAGIAIAVLGVLTWRRGFAYADAETLWRDTLEKNPTTFIANNNLGGILLQRGELDTAVARFQAALGDKPDFAEAFDNLGMVKQRQGRPDEAIALFRQALRSDPNLPNAHNNLGIMLAQGGNTAGALEHFDQAVKLRPSFAKAQQNRGISLERLGRTGEAVAAYRETLRLTPATLDVQKRLAWILATDPDGRVRNGAEAVRLATAASAAAGERDPQALDVLAAAFAEAGRLDDAVRAAERALELAGTSASPAATEAVRARIALYRSGRAFRSTAP